VAGTVLVGAHTGAGRGRGVEMVAVTGGSTAMSLLLVVADNGLMGGVPRMGNGVEWGATTMGKPLGDGLLGAFSIGVEAMGITGDEAMGAEPDGAMCQSSSVVPSRLVEGVATGVGGVMGQSSSVVASSLLLGDTVFSGERPSELGATGCNGAALLDAADGDEPAVGAGLGEAAGGRFGPCLGATGTEPALGADTGEAAVVGALGMPCGEGIG
jgi:hypothetical protein